MIDFLQYCVDALSLGSLYALVALGIGLLFGILRLVNFAHGDFVTIGAYALIVPSADVTARLFIGAWNWFALVPSVFVIVVIAALLADALVFRQLRRAAAPSLMIASFAVGYIVQNGVMMIFGSRAKALSLWSGMAEQVSIGQLRISLLEIVTIVGTMFLMASLALFLKTTALGVQMRAAAEDFQMARYLGVRANTVIAIAIAISAVLAAAVSLLYVSRTGVLTAGMGTPLVLFGFVATVVGGMGTLQGAVLGGFVLGFTTVFLSAYLPDDLRAFRDAFAFGLVILILLLRPSGIISSKALVERV
jgi:branched-chain amino acid transport system permease protein